METEAPHRFIVTPGTAPLAGHTVAILELIEDLRFRVCEVAIGTEYAVVAIKVKSIRVQLTPL